MAISNLKYSKLKGLLNVSQLIFDFVLSFISLLLVRFIRARTDLIPGLQLPTGEIPEIYSYMAFAIYASIGFVVIMALQGIYFRRNRNPLWREISQSLFSVIAWMALLSTYFYFTRNLFFSRLALIYGVATICVGIVVLRILYRYVEVLLIQSGRLQKRTWIFGFRSELHNLEKLVGGNKGYYLVESFSEDNLICRDKSVFERMYRKDKPDLLIIGPKLREHTESFVLKCAQTYGVDYMFFPQTYSIYSTNAVYNGFWGNSPFILINPTIISGFGAFIKRFFDIVCSLFFLVVLSPVFLLVSFISVFSNGFPIFYLNRRVGRNGEEFTLYKFRSMINDAEKMKAQLEKINEREGKLFKMKNDPRITKWGKFIRKWSIDELPQIINILKGDMSFIGPRPHEPKEVSKYSIDEIRLLSVRPGITSFYATHDRKLPFEKEVELETYYIENWSLILDAYIFIRTIFVVLKGSGE